MKTCVCCGQEAVVVVTIPSLMALCRGHYNLLNNAYSKAKEARR